MEEAIKNIFTVNLGVNSDELVLVFTDLVSDSERVVEEDLERRGSLKGIAEEVARAGREFCEIEYVEFPSVGGHGKEPPVLLWEAAFGEKAVKKLKGKGLLEKIIAKEASRDDLKAGEEIVVEHGESPDAVVALSNYSTSHTRFRDFLTRCNRARYASMPIFDKKMLTGVMTADWNALKERTLRLVDKMSGGEEVYITSKNGTSISFSIKGRTVEPDTGIITEPGTFGNLPAGEAFLAPVEGTAEGMMVLEWAPTRKLLRPIELVVKGGSVVTVDGDDDYAMDLKDLISFNPLVGNIAELGIGTNDKATRPDNILETEKILGSVHIALGDNSSFGGKVSVPFHQDFIFFKPTLEVVKGGRKVEILIQGEPRF
jgi:leucyl aminopeptidase (aminopeptidase T)